MGIKRVNYKNLLLKESVIPKLRKDIPRLKNNVAYDYPREKAKFPLIVINITDSPSVYDIGKNEIISNVNIRMSILAEYQSDCMDLEYDVTTCMLELGYTRLEPTLPFKNGNYDKFQIDINYKIKYNALLGNLERSV